MKSRSHHVALVIFAVLVAKGLSQDAVQWRTYVDSENEIWFQAPSTVSIYREGSPKRQTLYAFVNSVSISISKEYLRNNPADHVKGLSLPFGHSRATTQAYTLPTFLVREENELMGNDRKLTLYAGSKRSYFKIILTAARDNPFVARFVETIRFGGSRIQSSPSVQELAPTSTPIVFDKLPNSPDVEGALARNRSDYSSDTQLEIINTYVPMELTKLSSDLIILQRPRPMYTDSARTGNVQGIIPANVEFLANGEIGSIRVDNRLDKGWAENVVRAVRKIRFIPAAADGKPVDVVRTLIYRFSIY